MSVAAARPQVAGALSAGVDGLSDIPAGGCAPPNIHLVTSQPGTGRTTLGLPLPGNGNERGSCITLFVISNKTPADAAGHMPGNRTYAKH